MREAGPSHGARRADPETGTAELGPGRSLRLLVVEDNPANQRVASMLLGKMGYAVQIAGNGQLGLVALAAGEFDAVVMDCQMPVMDGYEATRRIRTGAVAGIDPKVPVIAVTAYARTEDRARCLDAGMNDYVTKPIRAAELRLALERCGLVGRVLRPTESGVEPALQAIEAAPVIDEGALQSARDLPGLKGPSLLPELIEMYLADDDQVLARLGELVVARRGELLAEEAHSFGGGAATFGGMQVRREALELERVVRAGDWPAANRVWSDLRAAGERLRDEVKRRNLSGR